MADEIKVNVSIHAENGEYKESFTRQMVVDQTTLGTASGIQTIGTSEEDVATGDVSTPGITTLHNLDATNFVDYGMSDAGTMKALGRLKPGEFAMFRLKPSTTLRMVADTAPVKVRYWILSD